ncbi:hypothetical protein HDU98_000482 [Podochytrium sp. JEL0797]|nr:hypothetical protein HDU98_000482 [Podochytrium sp. JEL0797]
MTGGGATIDSLVGDPSTLQPNSEPVVTDFSIDALFDDSLANQLFPFDDGSLSLWTSGQSSSGEVSSEDWLLAATASLPNLNHALLPGSGAGDGTFEWEDEGIVGIDQNGMCFQWGGAAATVGGGAGQGGGVGLGGAEEGVKGGFGGGNDRAGLDENEVPEILEAADAMKGDGELRNIVNAYLSDSSDECTLLFQSTKITQKSYGVEKRFLCPPPQVTLIGAQWTAHPTTSAQVVVLQPNHISATKTLPETTFPIHTAELTSDHFMRVDLISKTTHLRDTMDLMARTRVAQCVFKGVYVGDSEAKRMEMRCDVWKGNKLEGIEEIFEEELNWDGSQGAVRPVREVVENGFVFGSEGSVSRALKEKGAKGVEVIELSEMVTLMRGVKSMNVRIVSKPTKRVSVAEMIFSGTAIALFNRLKSQKITTKYLASDHQGTHLTVTNPSWQPWIVWKLTDPRFDLSRVPCESPIARTELAAMMHQQTVYEPFDDELVWVKGTQRLGVHEDVDVLQLLAAGKLMAAAAVKGGSEGVDDLWLKFGDVVVLQNAVTGLCTRPLVCQHMDSLGGSEECKLLEEANRGSPVGQLNRVCFSVFGERGKYMTLTAGMVLVGTEPAGVAVAVPASRHASKKRMVDRFEVSLGESAIWTVVTVDQAEYSFWKPKSHTCNESIANIIAKPSVPIPTVFRIQSLGKRVLLFSGQNFTSSLSCFIGCVQAAKTEVLCGEIAIVEVGDDVFGGCGALGRVMFEPVLLVSRVDGCVFRTGFYSFL